MVLSHQTFRMIMNLNMFSFSFIDAGEDGEDNENLEIICENCQKQVKKSLISQIGQRRECKLYYGPRYDEMKNMKQKNSKTRKRKSRY